MTDASLPGTKSDAGDWMSLSTLSRLLLTLPFKMYEKEMMVKPSRLK